MECPFCKCTKSYVNDSRAKDTLVLRKRECQKCGAHFTTQESVTTSVTGRRTVDSIMATEFGLSATNFTKLKNLCKDIAGDNHE